MEHHPISPLSSSARRAAQQAAKHGHRQRKANKPSLRTKCLCSVIIRRHYKAQDHLSQLEAILMKHRI